MPVHLNCGCGAAGRLGVGTAGRVGLNFVVIGSRIKDSAAEMGPYLQLMQLPFQLLKFKFDGSLFCVQPIVLRGLSERAHSRQRGLHSRYAFIQSVFLHCFRHQRWLGAA